MNEKEKRLAAWCRKQGVEGVLLRRRTNIAWLTDGADVHVDSTSSTGIATLLWTPRKKTVFTSNIEAPRLKDEEFGDEWEVKGARWWEPAKPPRGRYATDFPDDPFCELRAMLTPSELTRVRCLGTFAGETVGRAVKSIRPGMSELEVAGRLSATFRAEGIVTPVLLVAADGRIARYRHPIPTAREIEKTAMVAVCPRYKGIMVAITRLVHFGRTLPAPLRRKHDAVCKVDAAFHRATRPGARWCDVLAAGLRVYRSTGFAEEWRKHHQGGPMGYEGRDFKATPTEERKIVRNQIVGWNPSITGTKSEDAILSSGEVLTATPNWPSCGSRPDILCRG